jgi:hypothetical protein
MRGSDSPARGERVGPVRNERRGFAAVVVGEGNLSKKIV